MTVDSYTQHELRRPCPGGETAMVWWFTPGQVAAMASAGWRVHRWYPDTVLVPDAQGRLAERR